jgi:hypothetical protein
MIDRVKMEFEGAGLEPRPYRLAAEVEKVFHEALEEFQHDLLLKLDAISKKVDLITANKKLRDRKSTR